MERVIWNLSLCEPGTKETRSSITASYCVLQTQYRVLRSCENLKSIIFLVVLFCTIVTRFNSANPFEHTVRTKSTIVRKNHEYLHPFVSELLLKEGSREGPFYFPNRSSRRFRFKSQRSAVDNRPSHYAGVRVGDRCTRGPVDNRFPFGATTTNPPGRRLP